MKYKLDDSETLSKCKSILDKWSASQPYSPTQTLGTSAELVSADIYTLERLTLETSFRVRYAGWMQEAGGSYSESPNDETDYDIWNDVLSDNKEEDFDFPIRETRTRVECNYPGCEDGKIECNRCDENGTVECSECHNVKLQYKRVGYIVCPTCGKGESKWDRRSTGGFVEKMTNGKVSRSFCPNCNPGGRGSTPGFVVCPECHGTTRVTCSNCGGTHHVECPRCHGYGYLVKELHVIQKCASDERSRIWKPHDNLTNDFCAFDRVPWQEIFANAGVEETVDMAEMNLAPASVKAVFDANDIKSAWQSLASENEEVRSAFRKENDGDRCKIVKQRIALEQYEGIIKYTYRFEGNEYTAWINLATECVEECENGLYAAMAADTVESARVAEKEGDPQSAIYYYCKADAISLKWSKENKTQNLRVKQYRMIGLLFGGSMLLSSLLVWVPGLVMSGMDIIGIGSIVVGLVVMTACLVSLNEAIQILGFLSVFGLSFLATQWFGEGFAKDLVVREGLLMSLLTYSLICLTVTTDYGQRLPKGRRGLILGGIVAGLLAAPISLYVGVCTQSFAFIGGGFIALAMLAVIALVRLPRRLKAGKMQRFVEKHAGQGVKIRSEIESRKPGSVGLRNFIIVSILLVIVSIISVCLGETIDSTIGNVHLSIITTLMGVGVL